ncbi:MAG TPA: hypothetical protein QF508_04090 [Candidatus Thalassarchaeaceae archaeon]|jgi:hypothetical protein|nr:hypothetical protein [Candidatus Thalassarchaeaceae archaeon]MDP7658422.1 hypothetical protein [Candidatus Thalassarchaeaceae archaeon]HJO42569.1 hypothetical protein [Candidatus Thalassarchaeaceae archaeon]|tara:strand:- start:171 stop:803 length:633 start_codon:yes stop_codon:yes gene_type:complete
MTRILIHGTELISLICAHSLLDSIKNVEIHLVDSKAEVGLLEEGPGLISANNLPILPNEWIGSLKSQQPRDESTAIRRSWFEKACATKLASRGVFFHLRSKTNKINKSTIKFEGAGLLSGKSLEFDIIINQITPPSNSINWSGGTHSSSTITSPISGIRPDGLVEEWWGGVPPNRTDWLQRMEWKGVNPRTSIIDDIETGKRLARNAISL